ncbi:monofunctional biosynthetic peptidoglycan transglycosylase [Moraxella canis]|uniref:Biosynthetic peptidoglycan transglycosylase n=1 Tax=Moraxella canis TaxID=90239 RepID=A0A1S9ZMS4_9GAMM|nr:monofunctional biosynthetic peptidoglycan transglycosylase [Moraxella canis]OOR84678.1 monofunctional biosynthetic peptidoglycan transglycosylase [Moraxella canis]
MFRTFFKWILAPLLVLFFSFHVMVAGLLVVWGNLPVQNSAFMLWHRLSGGSVTQTWVDYDRIAKSAKQAAVASEDGKFVMHRGFDFDSMQTAMRSNEAQGAVSAGGSTISQQLAKNLFLTSHRSYVRKAEEAIIVVMMETLWSKQRILEVYLNVAEFGEGIYGIEAASRHYFGRSAANLSRDQAALLISLLPNPKYYGERLNAKRLRNKQRIIIRRMNSAQIP